MTVMPSWRMPGSDGRTWTSGELKGSTYVIYFYPKDQTPGCTVHACDFRDNLARLQAVGIKVFGVSPDSLASHHKFSAKEKLTFPLLTDNDHALATKLGVWAEKSLYGRTFPGIERTTFLVGPEGVIIGEWRRVKVAGHVAEVVLAATGVTVPPPPTPLGLSPVVAPLAPPAAAKLAAPVAPAKPAPPAVVAAVPAKAKPIEKAPAKAPAKVVAKIPARVVAKVAKVVKVVKTAKAGVKAVVVAKPKPKAAAKAADKSPAKAKAKAKR